MIRTRRCLPCIIRRRRCARRGGRRDPSDERQTIICQARVTPKGPQRVRARHSARACTLPLWAAMISHDQPRASTGGVNVVPHKRRRRRA
ncbi:hypothetical protein P171DRAFT_285392 [Karstenula rhodostoma CBS 690.94]|uniref:Uncharacterized protein n=1 Tax=Karstenula rhodostoma CBS 690.94 TaxID=1392251 RepID=A0A9P4PIV9_9PLEO|nr:hypothetical protein P171DRAFT_285392 [Karstenula rhodostoma CBS 690.94]